MKKEECLSTFREVIIKRDSVNCIWGLRPQAPGIYRFIDQSMRKKGGEHEFALPLILRSSVRRSGRFPALPYPPNRQQTIIKTNSIHQGKLSTGEKK